MLNFDFLEKDLGIASPPHFVYDFSKKIFFMLYFTNWPNFIASLSLLLDILINMCIAIACFPGCDVRNFEIKLIFLIKPFFLHDQKVKTLNQNFKYLENKKLLKWNKKHFSSFLKDFQLLKIVSDLSVRP